MPEMIEEQSRPRRRDALAPIWLFFIIFGIQAVILGRIVIALDLLSPVGQTRFIHSSWLVAGAPALVFSLIRMRPLLRSTPGDRFLYFLLPSIIVAMMGFGVFLLIR